MTHYRAYLAELAENMQPDYIGLISKALRLHLERDEFPRYRRQISDEEDARFDFWREKITLDDFKVEVGRYWKGDYDKFLEFVMTVKDELDAHVEVMEKSRKQAFVGKVPGESALRAEKERAAYRVGDEYVDRLVSERSRQWFLDKH